MPHAEVMDFEMSFGHKMSLWTLRNDRKLHFSAILHPA